MRGPGKFSDRVPAMVPDGSVTQLKHGVRHSKAKARCGAASYRIKSFDITPGLIEQRDGSSSALHWVLDIGSALDII